MTEPLFRKLDCYMLRADDFEAATAFYRDRLGHPLLWRTDDAIAFGLPESDAELVVHRTLGPEANLLVGDADQAYRQLTEAGAPRSSRLSTSQLADVLWFAILSATVSLFWTSPRGGS